MQQAQRHRHARPGRLLATVFVGLAMLLVGMAAGAALSHLWFAAGGSARSSDGSSRGSAPSKQLYTCGMHPNVIQAGPGKCPICHMKLTPLRDGDAAKTSDGAQERKVLYWRAPMDPAYVSDKPGVSPMGMELVPVYADESDTAAGVAISIDPITRQNMGIRTAIVQRGPLARTIRTVGRVDYDEQTVSFVDTKFEGWIEKLHVNETGRLVQRGEPLFAVYSPKLWEAQEEYLTALRGIERLSGSPIAEVREEARRLVEAAELQLRYFDITEDQIAELRRAASSRKTLTMNSPATGIVTEKMALGGMYVRPGMRLFTIADLSKVWVYVDIFEYQLPWVRIGQEATMTLPYVPGRAFRGRVAYVYPYLEKQTRVIKVRLEFDNPTLELKPEMYANVMLRTELDRDALLIRREAYIDSGVRKVAFVRLGSGSFEPRDIQVGVEAEDGMVEVLYGLDAGERVVISGQFMLDAESKLKEAIAKMLAQQAAPSPETDDTDRESGASQSNGHNHQ